MPLMGKTYACFFNGPTLGGAERSFGKQVSDLKSVDNGLEFRFYLPYLENIEETTDLKNYIISCGFRNTDIFYYQYNKTLYSLSRTSGLSLLSYIPKLIWGMISTIRNLNELQIKNPDVWWVGGNKVGFVIFFLGLLCSFKGKVLWHFRDYPYAKGFYKILPLIFKLPHSFSFESLSNSFDVNRAVKNGPFVFDHYRVLYNPVGDFKFNCREGEELTFGCASMLAPWKGVHSITLFALLYEKELKELGYEKFLVFGDQIYKTAGEHTHYKSDLKNLVKKFGSDFVEFRGLQKPQDIFNEVDVFVHSSLKPEPFGRVIVEAFKAGSLVVSTGLGGAGELIKERNCSLQYISYDYPGLFEQLSIAASEERFKLVQEASLRARDLQEVYEQQLQNVFGVNSIKSIKKS